MLLPGRKRLRSLCGLKLMATTNRTPCLGRRTTDNVALSFVRVLNDVLAEFLG
jgi:hypothetical protein